MSKAFLRESDFEIPDEPLSRAMPTSAAGGRLSFTPDGAARLGEELRELSEVERPKLAGADPMGVDERTALQAIDQRIRLLAANLRAAEIIEAPESERDVIRFGAWVTVRDRKKDPMRYRIVGVAEAELEPEWISWESPLGRALIGRRAGERVVFAAPVGEMVLDIEAVEYS